jgi:hypothetical protein
LLLAAIDYATMRITIRFRAGEKVVYEPKPRPGGSYTKSIRYEGGMAIVKDEWGKETAYPIDTIESVETHPDRF